MKIQRVNHVGAGVTAITPANRTYFAATLGAITPTYGNELVTNGGMEAGNPPSNWSGSNITLTTGAERTGGTGTQSLIVTSTSGGTWRTALQMSPILPAGGFCKLAAWLRGVNVSYSEVSATGIGYITNYSTDWASKARTNIITLTGQLNVALWTGDSLGNAQNYDDVSLKLLSFSSMLTNSVVISANPTASVKIALTPSPYQAGLTFCYADDNNKLAAWHDGTNVRLCKWVSGTFTMLINTAIAFVNNAVLQVVKSGTSVSVFYNGSQVGATQTVDAVFNSYNVVSPFATDSSVVANMSNFTARG